VRAAAADLLGQLGRPEAVPQLRAAAQADAQWLVRVQALAALVAILDEAAGDDLRHTLQHDPDPQVRVKAVQLAGSRSRSADLTELLLEALKDRDAAVRVEACLCLQRLTGKSHPPDFLTWVTDFGTEARSGEEKETP